MSDDGWVDVDVGDDGWVDVPTPHAQTMADTTVEGSKQFGSGMLEGIMGIPGLVTDSTKWVGSKLFGSPEDRLAEFQAAHPDQAEAAAAFYAPTDRVANYLERKTVAPDPDYRYARRVGQFVGPSLYTGGIVPAITGAFGSQGLEDVTGNHTIAPLVGAIGGSMLPGVIKNTYSGMRTLFRGATPTEIEGSAALALKEQTGLTADEILTANQARPKDSLGNLMTTAEVTGNPAMGQAEKTLGGLPRYANEYSGAHELRNTARENLLSTTTGTKAISKEDLGSGLISRASDVNKGIKGVERQAWDLIDKTTPIDSSAHQSAVAAELALKDGGLPLSAPTTNLLDQFLSAEDGATTVGRLQSIRSDAGTIARNAPGISEFEKKILAKLSDSTEGAITDGISASAAQDYATARGITAARNDLFGKKTLARVTPPGKTLTDPKLIPDNAVQNTLKGGRDGAKKLKLALGNDADTIDDYSRGIIDQMRNGKEELTPARARNFISENRSFLKEFLGDEHFDKFQRVADDLASESSVGKKAFRASDGNSVTAQKQTVAGALNDIMSESLVPGTGMISKVVEAFKRAGNIRDQQSVQDLLFKAAMKPEYAAELAAKPTAQRIMSVLERFTVAAKEGGLAAGQATALEMNRPEYQKPSAPKMLGAKSAPLVSGGDSVFSPSSVKDSVFSPAVEEVLPGVRMVESSGGKNTVGAETKYGTAKGPYQLLDLTGEEWHKKLGIKAPYDPFDEVQSKKIAGAYLDYLLQETGDMETALTAYHTGLANVRKGKVGPIGRKYAANVLDAIDS